MIPFLFFLFICYLVLFHVNTSDSQQQAHDGQSPNSVSYSNPRNNHDDRKHPHASRESAEMEVRRMTRYSNPRNNHDDRKYPHTSRESVEMEVRRMKRHGYEGSDRLNVYYNESMHAWFVGRSSRNY